MAKNDNLKDFLTDVADAIRAKKGTSAAINPQDFSAEIASIETGGAGDTPTPVSSGAINFKDYDGTILHSFTKDAFLALTEMPTLPTQKGLTCQGWNYSLENAKTYVEKYGRLDIGATYITDDGKTRLYITIAAEGRMSLQLNFKQTIANGVVIDWGDGSETNTYSGTSFYPSHVYQNIGDYVITLEVVSGELQLIGSSNYSIMGYMVSNSSRVYPNMLKKVEIGSGVTSIKNYAFNECYSLSSITIPNSVTSVENYAFYYCYSLSSVVIPNSVTSIGSNAFYYCYSLSSITIPNSVTSIGKYAFYKCFPLSSVVIPNNVTSIGNDTFSQCYSLSSITIPNSVTSVGNNVFEGCYSLSSVVIPNSVTSIGNNVFKSCSSLSSITIPNSVTSVGNNVFEGCYSLSSVVIPNSVTSIGNYAFYYCYSLSSITIPNSVTSIGSNAFYYCSSLSSITIPNSVTSIGSNAFYSCKGIAFLDFSNHTSVPTLSNTNAFSSVASDLKIVVPDALYDEWIAATNWSTYASKIVKASEFNG